MQLIHWYYSMQQANAGTAPMQNIRQEKPQRGKRNIVRVFYFVEVWAADKIHLSILEKR